MVDLNGIEPSTSCVQGRCSPSWATGPWNGRKDRIRTCDLSVPNRALYQTKLLSVMARLKGFEPLTFWSVVKRSVQLIYRRIIIKFYYYIVILLFGGTSRIRTDDRGVAVPCLRPTWLWCQIKITIL